MAATGKTGADAIYIAFKHICHVIVRFGPKLTTVLVAARDAGVITADEYTIVAGFVAGAQAICNVWAKVAGFSGF